MADEARLTVSKTPAFTRYDRDEGLALPAALRESLFGAKPGEAVGGPTENGFAIAVLDGIEPAAPSPSDAEYRDLGAQLKDALAADLLAQYTRALRRDYPVRVDAAALDRLFDEGIITR